MLIPSSVLFYPSFSRCCAAGAFRARLRPHGTDCPAVRRFPARLPAGQSASADRTAPNVSRLRTGLLARRRTPDPRTRPESRPLVSTFVGVVRSAPSDFTRLRDALGSESAPRGHLPHGRSARGVFFLSIIRLCCDHPGVSPRRRATITPRYPPSGAACPICGYWLGDSEPGSSASPRPAMTTSPRRSYTRDSLSWCTWRSHLRRTAI